MPDARILPARVIEECVICPRCSDGGDGDYYCSESGHDLEDIYTIHDDCPLERAREENR